MDNDSLNRLVQRLLEDAAEENSQYLGMLVSAWMQKHDVDPADIELVIDTSDPARISLYPRVKPYECGCAHDCPGMPEIAVRPAAIDELW